MKLSKSLIIVPLSALLFACTGPGPDPDPVVVTSSSSASSVPVPAGRLISDINFPDPLMAQCVADTGAIVVSQVTELGCIGNISDVTGIAELTSLATFELANSSVTSLDLSSNNALSMIQLFYNNQMTSLIPPVGNPEDGVLLYVYIEGGQVTDMNFSESLWLANLSVKNSVLTSLDLSGNTRLGYIELTGNSGIQCSSIEEVRALNPASFVVAPEDEASCT